MLKFVPIKNVKLVKDHRIEIGGAISSRPLDARGKLMSGNSSLRELEQLTPVHLICATLRDCRRIQDYNVIKNGCGPKSHCCCIN